MKPKGASLLGLDKLAAAKKKDKQEETAVFSVCLWG
jgi:hypothetical protein